MPCKERPLQDCCCATVLCARRFAGLSGGIIQAGFSGGGLIRPPVGETPMSPGPIDMNVPKPGSIASILGEPCRAETRPVSLVTPQFLTVPNVVGVGLGVAYCLPVATSGIVRPSREREFRLEARAIRAGLERVSELPNLPGPLVGVMQQLIDYRGPEDGLRRTSRGSEAVEMIAGELEDAPCGCTRTNSPIMPHVARLPDRFLVAPSVRPRPGRDWSADSSGTPESFRSSVPAAARCRP